MSEDEIELTIDGKKVRTKRGTTLYQIAREQDIHLPIFCYHDRMKPFGACRVCLVEVEKMGKLQTSCTMQAQEGMVVHTHSNKAIEGRKSILEFLLINHPLDCPICDKGGECPLQDQALEDGPQKSRFFEEKRHLAKRLPLTPVLMLDRERCILCARCTRFSDDLAKDHALEIIDRGFRAEIASSPEKKGRFKFLSNTISICPVGALTSQAYRFRARPWDNQTTKSTCTLCPIGCSTHIDCRDNQIVRIRADENKAINDVWLCDKGAFGYEYVRHPDRIETPLIRKKGALVPCSWDEAFLFIENNRPKPQKSAALGGMALTTEENYLLQALMRQVFETPHLDYRVGLPSYSLAEEGIFGKRIGSYKEIEALEQIILIGTDITEEFPLLWLAMSQAKLIFVGHFSPENSSKYDEIHLLAPLEETALFEELLPRFLQEGSKIRTAIYVGSQYLYAKNRAEFLFTLEQKRGATPVYYLEGKGNSFGARYAGMHPELHPENKKSSNPGLAFPEMMHYGALHGFDLLYVVGADPAKNMPIDLWQSVRARIKCLIVQDLFITESARTADLVLPALSCHEKEGTFITVSGYSQKLSPPNAIPRGPRADASIFKEIAQRFGKEISIPSSFIDNMAYPNYAFEQKRIEPLEKNISTKLRASFSPRLFDEGSRLSHSPHLRAIIEEPYVRLHPTDARARSLKDNETVYLVNGGVKIAALLKTDGTVSPGCIVIPKGFNSLPITHLGINLLNGIEMEIKRYD